MAENRARRDLLRDTAIRILAAEGARKLTHRQVDDGADVPPGTTKNYFPTRDKLLVAAAERVYERYVDDQHELAASGAEPRDRLELARLIAELIRRGTGTDRPRLLALLELHAEATRHRPLSDLLGRQNAIDFAMHEKLQRAAGLPVTQARARAVARSTQAAMLSLLTHPPDALSEQGLDDLDTFAAEVIDTVYPVGGTSEETAPR